MPRLFSNPADCIHGDFRDDLETDGFVIVKGAISGKDASGYAAALFTWLEQSGLELKREDSSVCSEEYSRILSGGDMTSGYGNTNENFMWAIRSEPLVLDAFEKIYGTKDVLVSFDAVSMTLPRQDAKQISSWPHRDQDSATPGFRCIQGLIHLLPSGSNDGGLVVCKGSHRTNGEMHEVFGDDINNEIQTQGQACCSVTEANQKWLEDVKGLEWVKVCAEPGDLILWDSRTVHYILDSPNHNVHLAVYISYSPIADITQEDLIRKRAAFEKCLATTNWPNFPHTRDSSLTMRSHDEHLFDFVRQKPRKPRLEERSSKLAGIRYIDLSTA